MVGLRFPRRLAVVLVLSMVLTAPVLGAESRPRADVRKSNFVVALASELRVQLWSSLSRLWPKAGCGLDPHGRCADSSGEASAPTDPEEGCGLDPNGACGH